MGGGARPPKGVRIGQGGGCALPFLIPLPLFPLSPSPLEGRGGANPTRSGVLVGSPHGAPPLAGHLLLPSFIYGGRGIPKAQQLFLSRVWFPLPQFTPSVILL